MQPAGVSEPPFRRVCIAGVGLIGGSIARRARRVWPDIELIGVDSTAVLETEDARDLLNERRGVKDLAAVARECNLTILATPVPAILEQIRELAATPALVTDAGSTKRRIMETARDTQLAKFVGGHPMAGSERHGLMHAHADLFSARRWFLVKGSAPDGDQRRLEAFVVGLGAEPVWTDAAAHDRAMAFVSHLPQIVAVALHNAAREALGDQAHAAGGRAFFEMTRLAASAPDVWEGILATNADFVGDAVAALARHLPAGADTLADGAWVQGAFERASTLPARARRDKD